MSSNSFHTYIYGAVLVAMVSVPQFAWSQRSDSIPHRGPYGLVVYLGGGLTRFVGKAGIPPSYNTTINRNGGAGTVRLMWHPDHRLDFGVETGWSSFYSYRVRGGVNDATVNVTGMPMLLVFSMPVNKNLRIFAGSGAYLLTSNLDYVGKVESQTFSLGFMASAMYVIHISDKVSLGAEFKWFNARETKDQTFSLQLMAIWKFYQW